jgi:hypothetical protein
MVRCSNRRCCEPLAPAEAHGGLLSAEELDLVFQYLADHLGYSHDEEGLSTPDIAGLLRGHIEASTGVGNDLAATQELVKFLDGRTIGVWGLHEDGARVWHWRGSSYDDGWVDLTADEVATLNRLMVVPKEVQ